MPSLYDALIRDLFNRGAITPKRKTNPNQAYTGDIPTDLQAEPIPLGTVNDILPRVGYLPPDPPPDALTLQRRKTAELQDFKNNPVKNNDRGGWGRLGDILRQFVVSAGDAYGSTDPRLPANERLGAALGGGIAGGTYAGFHPQIDEERQRAYDIAKSKQIESDLEKRQKADLDFYGASLNNLSTMQNLQLNKPVQVIDPISGQAVSVTGNQAYSQGQSALRQQEGFRNQAINQIRGQDFQRIENQKTRENNRAIAIASAQTAADRQRIENEIQSDRDHADAIESFFKRKSDRLLEISKLASSVGGVKGVSDVMISQIQQNIDRARELTDAIETEQSKGSSADRRNIAALTKQRDALMKQVDEDNLKLASEAGKAGASASQIEAIRKAEQEDRYPVRRSVPTYSPTIPQRPGGAYAGKVFASPESLQRAFPGRSVEEIRQIVQTNGGSFRN